MTTYTPPIPQAGGDQAERIFLDMTRIPIPDGDMDEELALELSRLRGEVQQGLTDTEVNRMVRKLVAATQEIETIKAQFAAALRHAQARLDQLNYLYARPIEEYTQAKIGDRKKDRKIYLTHGTLTATRVSGKPTVFDPDMVLAFLTRDAPTTRGVIEMEFATPDKPLIRESIDKTIVAKYVKATGDILPGTEITPDRTSIGLSVPGIGKGGKALSVKLNTMARPEITDAEEEAEEDEE